VNHTLIELYSPKPAWLALDAAARQTFFSRVGEGMGAILELGIEPLAFGEIANHVSRSAGQRFFAVWRAPNGQALDALVEGIAASGWHDYFETVNAAGETVDLAPHLGQLATAS
jgi:hypothetical protein